METINPVQAHKMWEHRLRSKSAFNKACKELTRHWEGEHKISTQLQDEILQGFRKFYDKRHWKYALIKKAKGIAYVNTIARSKSFAVVNRDGTRTTVSRMCKPVNIRNDVIEACRGSVHYEQILLKRKIRGNEMDHCNPGGFAAIFEAWVKDKDINELYLKVVHNDPRKKTTAKKGFKTFKEPILTEWTMYHKAHAKLQELTPEQHLEKTRNYK